MTRLLKKILQSRPLQPLWKQVLWVASHSLRGGDAPQNQPFWQDCHVACLQKRGFGIGSEVGDSGEMDVLQWLRKKLPEAAVIFDVGANRGDYAEALVAKFPKSEIYCFEPSAKTFELLGTRVGNAPNVHLFNLGMGDSAGDVVLYTDGVGSGSASVYDRRLEHVGGKLDLQEKITLETLDSFCRDNQVATIDFLKLDTEGHELNVLRGAEGLMNAGAIGSIQFEFGGCNIDSRTYFQDFFYLLDGRYFLYRILSRGMARVRRYSELDEVFTTTNYLALSRSRFPELEPNDYL